jgi:hypothetical protein
VAGIIATTETTFLIANPMKKVGWTKRLDAGSGIGAYRMVVVCSLRVVDGVRTVV